MKMPTTMTMMISKLILILMTTKMAKSLPLTLKPQLLLKLKLPDAHAEEADADTAEVDP